jgi:NAD(P)-dependent dehydrogenase (short-subunit alcohol dehydrogenase family)
MTAAGRDGRFTVRIESTSVLVTGGASGLGYASAQALVDRGAKVTLVDLPASPGPAAAEKLGSQARFVAADVTEPAAIDAALDAAAEDGALRAVVHCAGRGGPLRVLDKEGNPSSLDAFQAVVHTNLIGTFNVLSRAAARIAASDPVDGERGVVVMTASVAAFEGQIGQAPYASSKAGVVGLTICAARDLAKAQIRVCTIAPGLFDTPLLGRLREDIRDALGKSVPHPSRLGSATEFGALAAHIIENPMLNGETIRLDGAIRMAPR